jgi:hypothetical protein
MESMGSLGLDLCCWCFCRLSTRLRAVQARRKTLCYIAEIAL